MELNEDYIGGIDEVGRGSLAGPMISVAILFRSPNFDCPGVCDSKKLTPIKRDELFKKILHNQYLVDFGIGHVDVYEIDKYGIDRANAIAFTRAVNALPYFDYTLYVDGTNPVKGTSPGIRQFVEPKSDNLYPVVGAASILAKVIRDSYMNELDKKFPAYKWSKNKGYGSSDHREAIKYYGATAHHRDTFLKNIITSSKASNLSVPRII